MAANKQQCKAVGAAFLVFLYGLRDGLDASDAVATQKLVMSILPVVDDFKADTDAAACYALAGAVEAFGDKRAG